MSLSLTDLFQKYGVPHYTAGQHKNVREGWIGTECPYCVPGKSGGVKLGWRHAGYCTCWTCERVNPTKTLSLLLRIPVEEVRRLPIDRPKPTAREERPTGTYTPPADAGPLLAAHRAYLESRRIDPDYAAAEWAVGGVGRLGGSLAWRLFIPVHRAGVPVTWTTRAITARGLRYCAARPEHESLCMRATLYGWDKVTNAAVLVEGPADCWAVGPGCVATLGLGCSPTQIAMLAKLALRVICFDNEPAAQRRAREVAKQLAGFPGATYVAQLETGKDAADATDAERRKLRLMLA